MLDPGAGSSRSLECPREIIRVAVRCLDACRSAAVARRAVSATVSPALLDDVMCPTAAVDLSRPARLFKTDSARHAFRAVPMPTTLPATFVLRGPPATRCHSSAVFWLTLPSAIRGSFAAALLFFFQGMRKLGRQNKTISSLASLRHALEQAHS